MNILYKITFKDIAKFSTMIFIFAILFLVSRIAGFVYLAVVTIRNTSKEIKDSYQKTIDKNKEKLKNLNYTNPVTEYDNHGNEITQS